MTDWEDILNAYLEGRGLRADAEDLLMRLHLDPRDRDHVARSLRLADEIAAAVRRPQPSAGADARLLDGLRACPAPDVVPTRWRATADGFTADPAAPAPAAEEDLLDAALEGRVSLNELRAMRDAGRLTDSAGEALDALEAVEESVTAASPPAPAGLESRLRDRLRTHMTSEDGHLDARVAARLLAPEPPARNTPAHRDVIAAEEEPPSDDQ
jgi:hypothetical protein